MATNCRKPRMVLEPMYITDIVAHDGTKVEAVEAALKKKAILSKRQLCWAWRAVNEDYARKQVRC